MNKMTEYCKLHDRVSACMSSSKASLFYLSAIIYFLPLIYQSDAYHVVTSSLYDHQTLLNIRATMESWSNKVIPAECFGFPPPPFLETLPMCLRRVPSTLPWRKRRRRRGKRGGAAVRLRLGLTTGPAGWPHRVARVHEKGCGFYIAKRSWETPYQWIRQLTGDSSLQPRRRRVPCLRCGGVEQRHLRSLERVFQQASQTVSDSVSIKVNSRSLGNKTFILNDLITAGSIDFLFVTETWLPVGDVKFFLGAYSH